MCQPWPNGPDALPLPGWMFHDPVPGYATRQLTLVMILRPEEAAQLQALVEKDSCFTLPPGACFDHLRLITPLEISPLDADGLPWLRVSAEALAGYAPDPPGG